MKCYITYFSLLLLFFSLQSVSAQGTYPIDEGVLLLGGSAGFGSLGGEAFDNRTFSLRVSPEASYFIRPNIAIGGALNFSINSFDGETDTFFGLGPQAAYYFGGEDDLVYPFVEASIFFLAGPDELSSLTYRAAGGIAYMISRNVAINGELFFQLDDTNITDTNNFGLDIGIKVFIY
ncbi:MAG: hypothetical protein AAF824_08350 [Bacteroidota bacterium]